MALNPVTITLPSDSAGSIFCHANAMYWQRVTLNITGGGTQPTTVVFQGTGEGVSLPYDSSGDTTYSLGTRQGTTISALFEFSTSGQGGPFQKANVRNPIINQAGTMYIVQVTSEDSTDNDNNDSYLSIVVSKLGSARGA